MVPVTLGYVRTVPSHSRRAAGRPSQPAPMLLPRGAWLVVLMATPACAVDGECLNEFTLTLCDVLALHGYCTARWGTPQPYLNDRVSNSTTDWQKQYALLTDLDPMWTYIANDSATVDEKLQTTLAYAHVQYCLDTCAVSPDVQAATQFKQVRDTGQSSARDVTLQQITMCDYLARNGACIEGATQLNFLARVASVGREWFKFNGAWQRLMPYRCAASCGSCGSSQAALDDYAQDESFCERSGQYSLTSNRSKVLDDPKENLLQSFVACQLYQPTCCSVGGQESALYTSYEAGPCSSVWTTYISQATDMNGMFSDSSCLRMSTVPVWVYVVVVTSAAALFVFIALGWMRIKCGMCG